MTDLHYTELQKDMVTPEFVAGVNSLLRQLSANAPLRTPEWLDYMLGSGTRLFVAMDGDKPIGTVSLVPAVALASEKDWIEDVVVDENYRRMGIASTLMGMAEQASLERGAKSINLTSNPRRQDARKMYETRGYEVVDTGLFRRKF